MSARRAMVIALERRGDWEVVWLRWRRSWVWRDLVMVVPAVKNSRALNMACVRR